MSTIFENKSYTPADTVYFSADLTGVQNSRGGNFLGQEFLRDGLDLGNTLYLNADDSSEGLDDELYFTCGVAALNEMCRKRHYDTYHRSAEELARIEGSLVDACTQQTGLTEGVVALIVNGRQKYFVDFGRTSEQLAFDKYDNAKDMFQYDGSSQFVYLLDLERQKIAHVKRIIAADGEATGDGEGCERVGLDVIDDHIQSDDPNESLDVAAIKAHHGIESFSTCWSIGSNLTPDGIKPTLKRPYSMLSYKSVFELARRNNITHIFAYLNKSAVGSLDKLGVVYGLLGGKELHSPNPAQGAGYDTHYIAVCIPDCIENRLAFTEVNPDKPLTKLVAKSEVALFAVYDSKDSK